MLAVILLQEHNLSTILNEEQHEAVGFVTTVTNALGMIDMAIDQIDFEEAELREQAAVIFEPECVENVVKGYKLLQTIHKQLRELEDDFRSQ